MDDESKVSPNAARLTPAGVPIQKQRMRTLAVAICGAICGAVLIVGVWAVGGMRVTDDPNPTRNTLIAAGMGVAVCGLFFGAFFAVLIYGVVLTIRQRRGP